MMDFGVFFCQQKNYRDFVRCAKLAEDVRFTFLGLIDSPYNFLDVYPMLTAIALGTERIQLGPYVTNPLTRHPSVTASTIATLNVMSEGRAFLGYGRGDSAVKMLGWKPAKWQIYEQSIKDIRAWMAGEPVEVEGAPAPVVIPWAKGEPEIPIDIGIFGPRGCRTAGQLADIAGCECAELGSVEWFRTMAQEEAEKAERGPIPFEISIATHVSDDIGKAREMCRWEPEIITNVLWHLMRTYPLEQLPPSTVEGFEWLAEIEDWWGQHDWSKHAKVDEAHKKIISDEIVDRWTVCGSVQTCVDKLRELEKIGVTRFCAYIVDLPMEEIENQIRTIGEKIIPEFTPALGARSPAVAGAKATT
jgi:alkanesulfonate monooxygenase SsuD/methylene tetrahydromethanopterin reductase-like flavin-dependent oxidoreductase (luciferase family)